MHRTDHLEGPRKNLILRHLLVFHQDNLRRCQPSLRRLRCHPTRQLKFHRHHRRRFLVKSVDSLRQGKKDIPCELITWDQTYQLARKLARQVRERHFEPEMIVAISRGGLMPARILSDHLNLFDLATLKVEHYHAVYKERLAKVRYPLAAKVEGKHVLLVDDVSDSGDTFEVAVEHLHSRGTPASLRTAVLHHKRVSSFVPDFFAEEIVEWRWLIYPWAVIEDLSSFLLEMHEHPKSVETFASELKKRHAIEVPRQILEDVFAINKR
jgi:hypoxanthine phosphoribosyltransferase